MKVYFIAGRYMGCNYVRALQPMWENGFNGNVVGIRTPAKNMKTVMQELYNADVIVFHRPESRNHEKVARELRALGKKIVFDNDDTFRLHKGHPFYKLSELEDSEEKMKIKNEIIDSFIKKADLVTTTTQSLATEYRELNDNVAVLPNCVNPEDWPEPKRNEGEKIRIGISGSAAYSTDFEIIQDYIRELDDRDDVQFVLFGLASPEQRVKNPLTADVYKHEYKFWDSLRNKEHVAWTPMDQYFETLNDLKLDIMLIPRKDNHFNRCKSNLKFLEAAMCEIPVVASSFKNGPYEELDGKNGIKLQDGWKETVDELIADPEYRRLIGKTARKYVIKNYDIKDHAYKWEELYKSLLK